MKKSNTYTIALMGLFAALCYVGTMINIPISIGAGKTMIHFGNIFCLLAALFLGGWQGGLCGSIGMGLYDLTSPGFQLYAPQTVVLKFCIGLLCGLVFAALGKTKLRPIFRTALACSAGMLFNLVFDPVASFLTSNFLLGTGKDAAAILTAWASVTTAVNAGIAVVAATLLYTAARPAIQRLRRS